MRIYLAGTFRFEKDMKIQKEMKKLLEKNGHTVWFAPSHFGKTRYHLTTGEELKKTIEDEKEAIKKCDLLLAVVGKATPGTMMEILFAFENGIPVITFLTSDDINLTQNPWLAYHSKIVRSKDELLSELNKQNGSL